MVPVYSMEEAYTCPAKSKSQLFILQRAIFNFLFPWYDVYDIYAHLFVIKFCVCRYIFRDQSIFHTMFSTLWTVVATILAVPTFLWVTTYACKCACFSILLVKFAFIESLINFKQYRTCTCICSVPST